MLFEKINEKQTRKKVDKLLNHYHSIRRLAGAPFEQRITPTYSLEPIKLQPKYRSPIESGVLRKIEAQETLRAIENAFNCVSAQSRQRLYFKYLAPNSRYDYEIYMHFNISKDTYYRELGKAQMEFAEAYKSGELLTYDP